MQEIKPPFTHWFSMQTDRRAGALRRLPQGARGRRRLRPDPGALVDKSDPALMAQMITQAGFGDQPNAFDSAAIEAEVAAAAPMQPWSNAPIGGESATWKAAYDRAVAGEFIADAVSRRQGHRSDEADEDDRPRTTSSWRAPRPTCPTSATCSSTPGCATWASRRRRRSTGAALLVADVPAVPPLEARS